MDIPLDIWKLISYYLPPYTLSICNAFHNIYNEQWFKHKLLSEYPNCTKNNNSWKDLYKKSLKSGNIYKYTDDINDNELIKCFDMEGIKISKNTNNFYYLLTFDGNLFSYKSVDRKNWGQELIDIDVNGLDGNFYIKGNKLYKININNKLLFETELLIEADDDFIYVLEKGSCFATTRNKLYQYRKVYGHILSGHEVIEMIVFQNILKIVYSGSIILQCENKEIYILDSSEFVLNKLDINNIVDIYPYVAKMTDCSFINLSCRRINTSHELITITDIIHTEFDMFTEKTNSIEVLIDGNIYALIKLEVESEFKPILKILTNNVKNLCCYNHVIM